MLCELNIGIFDEININFIDWLSGFFFFLVSEVENIKILCNDLKFLLNYSYDCS